MAKPNRGGKRGSGGGWTPAVSAQNAKGETIDLSGSPLRYGGSVDIPDAVKTSLAAFEGVKWSSQIEYARLIAADGRVLEDAKGGKTSVKTTVRAMNAADVFTHNHPRTGDVAGILGGTFSPQDVDNWANVGMRVTRAVAAEGTYSLAKLPGFDAQGVKRYYASVVRAARDRSKAAYKPYEDTYAKVAADYKRGKTDYAAVTSAYNAYIDAVVQAENRKLVEMHNALIAGQKKYGYAYALERRG